MRKSICMKLFSSAQSRALDKLALEKYKLPTFLLMEHAGLEISRTVCKFLRGVEGKKVRVVCGVGNNGGDGFVAARHLLDWGAHVKILIVGDTTKLRGDAKANFEILSLLDPTVFLEESKLREDFSNSDLIVDGLFGTGLTRPIEGEAAKVIHLMNESGKPIVAIDLPSGIDGDTGKIMGMAVRAATTVTLGVPKIGLYLYPGRELAGKIKIAYIAIPSQSIDASNCIAKLTSEEEVSAWIPQWKQDIHKGERGRVMIIGGSRGFSGAPALSAMAAVHAGAGLTYVAVPDGIRTLMEHKLTEPIKVGLPQTTQWVLGKTSLSETRMWFDKIDALAIGPGIGREEETQEYVRTVIREYRGPLVVDADALFALNGKFLEEVGRSEIILTPHEGEMGRLCDLPAHTIREQRLSLAKEYAKKWNVTLLLKGASTLIAAGDSLYVNPTGNPGMASGGSGDVLTGIVVALLGQKMEPLKSAVAGAFLHGLSGDILAKERGFHGITPEALSENLYKTFLRLR